MSDASAKGDSKAVDQALRDIRDTQGPLLAKSRAAAAHLPSPATKQRVLEALGDLDALLPQQENAARDAARNPRDAAKKNKLEALNRDIARNLDIVDDALSGDDPSNASSDSTDKIRKQAQKVYKKQKHLFYLLIFLV